MSSSTPSSPEASAASSISATWLTATSSTTSRSRRPISRPEPPTRSRAWPALPRPITRWCRWNRKRRRCCRTSSRPATRSAWRSAPGGPIATLTTAPISSATRRRRGPASRPWRRWGEPPRASPSCGHADKGEARAMTGMVNAFDPSRRGALSEEERALVARRERLLGPAYRLFYEHPVHLVRGEGVWLYDAQGQAYLDVYNNVPVVGHCHPRVVETLARQAATLNTHTRYLHEGVLDLAEALLSTFPPALSQVMFTCSGSEANDLAVRVAKCATGGTGFIVTDNAYHGVTDAVAGLSPSLGPAVAPAPHVVTVPAPIAADAQAFASDVDRAVASLSERGLRPAALMVDTIFSSDGVIADPVGLLVPAVERVRAAGALFIADEVQAGFARTGTAMWGFARQGLVPDLVTMGKPMGNGHPVAAMVAKPDLLEPFGKASRYFNTFGGNTVSVAVARTVLDVIAEEGLLENARHVGGYLIDGLRNVARNDGRFGAVRGSGLFIGMDIVAGDGTGKPDPAGAARIVNGLRDRRILISASGPCGNVLKIRPPLPFGREEADMVLAALAAVSASVP